MGEVLCVLHVNLAVSGVAAGSASLRRNMALRLALAQKPAWVNQASAAVRRIHFRVFDITPPVSIMAAYLDSRKLQSGFGCAVQKSPLHMMRLLEIGSEVRPADTEIPRSTQPPGIQQDDPPSERGLTAHFLFLALKGSPGVLFVFCNDMTSPPWR